MPCLGSLRNSIWADSAQESSLLSIHSNNIVSEHQKQGVSVPLVNDRPASHAYCIKLGKKDCRQTAELVEVGWVWWYPDTYLPQVSLNFVKPSSLPAAKAGRARAFCCHSNLDARSRWSPATNGRHRF